MKGKWPTLFLIWLMMLVAYFDRINLAAAGPQIIKDLSLTKTQFGYVLSAFTLGYALMQAPGGYLADRLGSKRLLVLAILVWSAFTAFTGLAGSLLVLLVIRVCFGVGEGIENGAQFKLVGDHFEPQERSLANGLFLTSLALGPALGLPLATWLISQYGWHVLFYVFAVIGVIVGWVLHLFLPSDPASSSAPSHGSSAGIFRSLSFWLCAGGYLCFNMAFWGFLGWIPTYLKNERHIVAGFATVTSLPYFCGFLGLLLAGRLGSTVWRSYRPALVGACYFCGALFLLVVLFASNLNLFMFGLSLAGFFLYGGFGPFWAIAIDQAPPESRGAFTGWVNFFGQVGGFVSPIIIGMLYDKMKSFSGALSFMIGSLVLGACVMVALQGFAGKPVLREA